MFFKSRIHLFDAKTLLGIATLTAATAGIAAANPSSAAALLAQAQSLVSCGTTAACVSGSNTSSGAGVAGTSALGNGVTGSSNAASGAGIRGTSKATGAGVSGFSPHGYGVSGTSADGFGTYGSTGGTGIGAYGMGTAGTGVLGNSLTGFGVRGQGAVGGDFSGTNVGLVGRSGADDAYPLMLHDHHDNLTFYVRASGAIVSHASGYGDRGVGADILGSTYGVIGRAPVSGYPLNLTDDFGNELFWVDGTGNVFMHGGLHAFSRTNGGATVQSFSPAATMPTVEDTGTAQLVGGVATVRLDTTFATSIDVHSAYRVFVTPSGDSHGLYVAMRTAEGFVVRESQGGKSSLSFDYRIVATAAGQAGKRMSVVAAPAAMRRALTPVPVKAFAQPAAGIK